MMIESKILDCKNNLFAFFQEKMTSLVEKSFILKHIDEVVLFFITLTIFFSVFAESEKLGVFVLCVAILSFVKMFIKKGAKCRVFSWDVALFVYFSICFISTINSTLLPQSIHGFLKTVIYVFYYFSVANYFQTNQNRIRFVFMLVALLCTFESVIAIVQNLGGVEQIATWQDSNYINPEDAISRAYGTLKPFNPNLLGGYLIAGLPFVLGSSLFFLVDRNFQKTLISTVAFLVCCLAIFATGSRGAYLGLGAILLGSVVLLGFIIKTDFQDNLKLKAIYNKVVTALAGLFVFVLIAVPKITKRLLSIFILRGDSSTSFRMNVYNSSWQMFCDNWFLGIGAGNQTFREIYGLYMLTGFDALSTYSVPLEIAVESGVLGLVAFVCFLMFFIIKAFGFIKKVGAYELADKVIIASSILTILGVMVHGLFDTIYFRPQVQFLFWTMVAMAAGTIFKYTSREV